MALFKRDAVSDAFQHAWHGYSTHCFGGDTFHPVSNTCDNGFGGWGATTIDSISTAIMLGKGDVVNRILKCISTLDFTKVAGGARIQMFEVTIRHFAGLISAWDLLNGPYRAMAKDEALMKSLYSQMIKLGDSLSCAFDTPSGVPRNWVDPALCKSDDGTSNTVAGAGTLILEFSRLSDITKDQKYARLARRAESYLLNPHPSEYEIWPGILGSFLTVADGDLINTKGSWGSLADSFYEYLLKAYVYNSEEFPFYLERWLAAADSTIRYIGSHPYGHPEWTLIPYWEGDKTFNYMDSLSWFVGGNMILGGMVTNNQTLIDYGLSVANTAGEIYHSTLTGLGGEFTGWTTDCTGDWAANCNAENSMRITSGEFKLRPEVLETWYYAFRATKDPKYREWIWEAFEAITTHCKTETGFSAIQDVNLPGGGKKLDQQESFLFAEVFEYTWLAHLEDDRSEMHVQDSRTGLKNTWVYNTEAHPFRVVGTPV
ncbi:glycoside hydrolase family 47 protein [Pseudocercospora fijiensis CIRAD86]|uniref:alpha-1,2-Mannosidase n=1 Tax=Pseudocercospora fijiensis (strain CIRAD86) TaxID=383855 RepID=M3A1X3_PSEFD|nr:glycoside hydrolase family 47 protein [Pseudocercospora fijiensis CIRAD86]EME78391.1 glycoside hydrolase family 47 protein [Pseudocercospora fijiensis CIRAD86]